MLGCTHYPFLKGAISYVMGEQVALVSSDVETANDVYRVLVSTGMERRRPSPPHLPLRGDRRLRRARSSTSRTGSSPPEIPSVELVQTGALTLPHHAPLRQENA